MNPLVMVAKHLAHFTATAHGRDSLERMGFGPGSQFVCCERSDTIASVSERSRGAEPPAVWAYLDEDDHLQIIVVSPVNDLVHVDGTPLVPQEYGAETTVEMLVHVARTTGENYFKPSRWDSPRRAALVDRSDLVDA